MKIEFLNEDCTRARITEGWFRKRSAIVYRINREYERGYWRFEKNNQEASTGWNGTSDTRNKLEWARNRKTIPNPWEPVIPLPEARIVR